MYDNLKEKYVERIQVSLSVSRSEQSLLGFCARGRAAQFTMH